MSRPKAIETKRTCPSCHVGKIVISGRPQKPEINYTSSEMVLSYFYEEWCTKCEFTHDGVAERRWNLE